MPTHKLTLVITLTAVIITGALWSTATRTADAHCQVPCGIYDEKARITQLYEDTTTISKAIRLMGELASKSDAQSHQQFVRWTATKEDHASRIITTIAEYFLTQKIKPVAAGTDGHAAYLKKLADHHAVMVAAMKAKQNADPAAAETLRSAIHTIQHYWDTSHKH